MAYNYKSVLFHLVFIIAIINSYLDIADGKPTVTPARSFDATADAKTLKAAMEGLGTDEDAIINVLTKRSLAQRFEIAKAYKRITGNDLITDLMSELSEDFADLINALMKPVTTLYADDLHTAISTEIDEPIIEILCTLSIQELQEVDRVYMQKYRHSIKDDMSGYFQTLIRDLCWTNRIGPNAGSEAVDRRRAKYDAIRIYMTEPDKRGTADSAFRKLILKRSFYQLRETFNEYERMFEESIKEVMIKEVAGLQLVGDNVLKMVNCIKSRDACFVAALQRSMAGLGTTEKTITRIIVGRSEIDLGDIKDVFNRHRLATLEAWINAETSGSYNKALISLLTTQ